MRLPRIAACITLAVAAFLSGYALAGNLAIRHYAPLVPVSCTAPLNDGTYKTVPTEDAERYDTGVYVCTGGRWVADPYYGQ